VAGTRGASTRCRRRTAGREGGELRILHAKQARTLVVDDTAVVLPFGRRWAAAQQHKPGTRKQVGRMLAHLERTPLGSARLVDVTRMHVQEWITELLDEYEYARGTVDKIYLCWINALFNAAVDEGLIPVSPVRKITLPPVAEEPMVVLTPAQVVALRDEMRPDRRAMVTAQAGLGVRSAELYALRRQDIDFEAGTVRVEWQLLERKRATPKTAGSRRVIPAQPHVLRELAAHILRWPPLDDGTIFFNPRNRFPYAGTVYEKVFRQAAARCAAVDPTWPKQRVTPHKLRHHFVTVALHAGATMPEVAEWIGDTLVVTQRVYAKVLPDPGRERTRKILAAMSRAYAGQQDDPGTGAPSEAREDSGRTRSDLRSV
jgi:integrase